MARYFHNVTWLIAVAFALSFGAERVLAASVVTITFDEAAFADGMGNSHGLVISTSNTPPGQLLNLPSGFPEVHLAVENFVRNPDAAVIFDTNITPTADPDLEHPFSVGNLASTTANDPNAIGNILIIQEVVRPSDVAVGEFVNTPDDEGKRPAGTLTFSFGTPITSFGFDLIDVEETGEFSRSTVSGAPGETTGFFAAFFNSNDPTPIAGAAFKDFITSTSDFFQSDVVFGNNSANRINRITAEQLGVDSFNRVEIGFGGSAGIDNITFTPIPSPAAVGVGLVGGIGLLCRRRRLWLTD